MLVESDRGVRKILERILFSRLGWPIMAYASSDEAVDALRLGARPDVIVIEAPLQKEKLIRWRNERYPQLPVIAFSVAKQVLTIVFGEKASVRAYSPTAIADTIVEVLGRQAADARSEQSA